MGIAALRVAAVLVAMGVASPALAQSRAVPAKAYGPEFSLPNPGADTGGGGGGITEYDLSLGCIIGGTAGTVVSVAAGGMNVVNLIAGGLVPAATPAAMWAGIGGVIFASFCSVGQALTPAVMASYNYFVPPVPELGGPTMDARYCQIAETLTPATPPSWGRALPARLVRADAEPM